MAPATLGIGIIGAGNIIKRHALAYHGLRDVARLKVVADVDPRRAEAARAGFGFEHALTDHRALLERDDVDVVDVCVPAHMHASMVIDALDAGKHVLCEKPMATTLADADRIIRKADERAQQTVSFVFQLRAEAAHRRLRMMIENGLIGRPLSAAVSVRLGKKPAYYSAVAGRGSWSSDGGGVLMNQAIHQLDALLVCLGEPESASAIMATFVQPIEAEDTFAGWVKFRSGAFATIECTVCAHGKTFSIDVLGENASLRIAGNPDADRFDWKIKAAGSAARRALEKQGQALSPEPRDPNPAVAALQKVQAKVRRKPVATPVHWGHTPFIRQFLEAVHTGTPGPVPPREARRSVELAAGLYQSAICGQPVQFPLDATSTVYNGVSGEMMPADRGIGGGAGAARAPVGAGAV